MFRAQKYARSGTECTSARLWAAHRDQAVLNREAVAVQQVSKLTPHSLHHIVLWVWGGGGARDVLRKPSDFRPARLGFQLGTRRGDCRACSSWPQGNLRIFPTLFWNSSSSSMPEMALLTASSTAVRQGRTA